MLVFKLLWVAALVGGAASIDKLPQKMAFIADVHIVCDAPYLFTDEARMVVKEKDYMWGKDETMETIKILDELGSGEFLKRIVVPARGDEMFNDNQYFYEFYDVCEKGQSVTENYPRKVHFNFTPK